MTNGHGSDRKLMDLIDDVRAFIKRYKGRPPRSTELGWKLFLALKARSSSPQQQALQDLVGGVSTLHAASISKLEKVAAVLKKKPVVARRNNSKLPLQLRNFATKQRYWKFDSDAVPLDVALSRPAGSNLKPVKLNPSSAMTKNTGFQQTPQPIVDMLYLMLGHWQQAAHRLKLDWCATWGTLLGAYREQAMIGHDYDVDVTLLVNDVGEFWEVFFPQLCLYFESRGFRFVKANNHYCKVLAGDCGWSTEWFELKATAARCGANRVDIIKGAAAMRKVGKRVRAQTPHVLDVLVAGTAIFKDGGHVLKKASLLPFRMKAFGCLSVPTPANSEQLLSDWFCPAWKTSRVYKDPITHKHSPVPRLANTAVWPSTSVVQNLAIITGTAC
jgi:hypothetical protein